MTETPEPTQERDAQRVPFRAWLLAVAGGVDYDLDGVNSLPCARRSDIVVGRSVAANEHD